MAENFELSRRVALNECRKVYIQRDYGLGCTVLFETGFPMELDSRIDTQTWTSFITELNQIYANAMAVNSASMAECLLGFMTCYLSRLCLKSVWEKRLEEVDEFLAEINNLTFIKRGMYVCNPIEKGLRVLEIVLLDEPMPKYQPAKPQTNNYGLPPLQPR